MPLDTLSTIINVINDQFNLKLVDICFNNMLQILCKSQLCFAKIWKIDYSKSLRFGLYNFHVQRKNIVSCSICNRFHQS